MDNKTNYAIHRIVIFFPVDGINHPCNNVNRVQFASYCASKPAQPLGVTLLSEHHLRFKPTFQHHLVFRLYSECPLKIATATCNSFDIPLSNLTPVRSEPPKVRTALYPSNNFHMYVATTRRLQQYTVVIIVILNPSIVSNDPFRK